MYYCKNVGSILIRPFEKELIRSLLAGSIQKLPNDLVSYSKENRILHYFHDHPLIEKRTGYKNELYAELEKLRSVFAHNNIVTLLITGESGFSEDLNLLLQIRMI